MELILLRHAHADSPAGLDDTARPLSPRGVAEAQDAARWIAAHGTPDRVLCSPAQRTRETLRHVTASTGDIDTRVDPRIYEATPGTLLDVLAEHRDSARLLLVGHNPGLESLVALLATGQSGDHRGMPPGSIAVLSLAADAPTEPGVARLDTFWSP
ncbi:SixA phosphatase family protein [Chiayiivirga flava]|uniref:Phosphohistidine phosphatase SixA n=1 Tax=Chiayiivirga flava TaxID=659595 RepID=A0A7W8D6J7_9GAMM|nr:histidine phosphatase family protein [Chiayiivirga flava]MBB5207720.1 phosphohistidine phosphatase SixA [Chiayiivirga flava]